MNIIQILLTSFLLLLIAVYIVYFWNKIFNRILFFVLFLVGLVLVFFPDLANKVAHWTGVGRRADLLLYLTIILFFAISIFLYSKVKNLQARQTEIVRRGAIEKVVQPRKPQEKTETPKAAKN